MKIGSHTDAFNSAYFNSEACLDRASRNDLADLHIAEER